MEPFLCVRPHKQCHICTSHTAISCVGIARNWIYAELPSFILFTIAPRKHKKHLRIIWISTEKFRILKSSTVPNVYNDKVFGGIEVIMVIPREQKDAFLNQNNLWRFLGSGPGRKNKLERGHSRNKTKERERADKPDLEMCFLVFTMFLSIGFEKNAPKNHTKQIKYGHPRCPYGRRTHFARGLIIILLKEQKVQNT